MKRGFIDGNNSGSASLDYGEKWFLFKAVEYYFPGAGLLGGLSSRPRASRAWPAAIAYSDLTGLFTMVQDEAESQRAARRRSPSASATPRTTPGRTPS